MRLSDREWFPAAVTFVAVYLMAAVIGITTEVIIAIGGSLTGR